MTVSSASTIVVLVCRAFSPDGALLCETAKVESPPTTSQECKIAADTVRETWNEINNYATWDAWAIGCPAEPYGLAVSKPALFSGTVEGD